MGRNLRRVVVACLSLALIAGLPASAWALSDGKRAARGAAYLASQQQPDGSIPAFSPIGSTSDAVLAFVSSGVGGKAMNKAIGYLRAQTAAGNVDNLGLRAKVVLALDAAGKDPSAFFIAVPPTPDATKARTASAVDPIGENAGIDPSGSCFPAR